MRSSDFTIKTLEDGKKVVQLKGNLAFDESFRKEMEESGVTEYVERNDE